MTKREIAHIIIEADTPLKVGSNSSDFLQDRPIQKDWNGLPMILGTSIAGVLRKHYRDENENDDLFGFQRMDKKKENDLSEGSKVILSNALLLDENKEVNEGLLLEKSNFLKIFDNLPIREHTKIDHRGVTGSSKEYSKFDEEVVYKGVQFKFSLEVLDDEEAFKKLLEMLQSPSFRLGGGTTKGFGKFKVLEIMSSVVDTAEALATYSSSLNSKKDSRVDLLTNVMPTKHSTYRLKITPDDFFMFGSGFGDEQSDQTPVYEQVIDYKKGKLSDKQILIPASSIKGALSHRTAFYYNKSQKLYADNLTTDEERKKYVDENNDAVKAIFGHKKELADDKKTELGQKGKLLISDCFKEDKKESTKVFDHVSIDRFTGGAIDGALFQEKTIAQRDEWEVEILLENDVNEAFVTAFENALDDVCMGMLALGGATTKGHGVFSGTWRKS
jgi:CRISPR/Cas system CSM-associated protein Csm3 (group 7 of RAMP superfamily)